MNRRFTPLALMILMAGATSFAETSWKDFYIKGGLANPQGDSRDMTRTTKLTKGFTFEGGYVLKPSAWDGEVRFYVGYVKMGGDTNYKPTVSGSATENGTTTLFTNMPYSDYAGLTTDQQAGYDFSEAHFAYDMTGHTYGVDFVFPVKIYNQNFKIFTGPSLHQWYMVKVNPKQPIMERNIKTGWRVGASYQFDEHMDVSVAYTQTEWRSVNGQTFEQGANPSRPAYLSLTAGYRF